MKSLDTLFDWFWILSWHISVRVTFMLHLPLMIDVFFQFVYVKHHSNPKHIHFRKILISCSSGSAWAMKNCPPRALQWPGFEFACLAAVFDKVAVHGWLAWKRWLRDVYYPRRCVSVKYNFNDNFFLYFEWLAKHNLKNENKANSVFAGMCSTKL